MSKSGKNICQNASKTFFFVGNPSIKGLSEFFRSYSRRMDTIDNPSEFGRNVRRIFDRLCFSDDLESTVKIHRKSIKKFFFQQFTDGFVRWF